MRGQIFGRVADKLKQVTQQATESVGLDRLISDNPLTTGLDDVEREAPFLDQYRPLSLSPIETLPETPGRGWSLRPGAYLYAAKSYCLRAGTHRPGSGGVGYASAPLKGPAAEAIQAVLANSALHPDIPQNRIQVLLWAIIARAKWENLAAQQRQDAAKLLTPAQIAMLNRNALNLLPGGSLDHALGGAAPALQRVLRAEADMRGLIARGASYEEMERVAVLPSDPNAAPGSIPAGRFSYDPAGYFINYQPVTYHVTWVEIVVPGPVRIDADALGRIVALTDAAGHRALRITYADGPGQPYPGAPEVRVYPIASVHYERPNPASSALAKADWVGKSSALIGVPSQRELPATPLQWQFENAQAMTAWSDDLLSSLNYPAGPRATILANLVHLEAALEVMLSQEANPADWKASQLDLVMDAWQWVFRRAAGAPALTASERPVAGAGLRAARLWRVGFAPLLLFGKGLLPFSGMGAQSGPASPPPGRITIVGTCGEDDDGDLDSNGQCHDHRPGTGPQPTRDCVVGNCLVPTPIFGPSSQAAQPGNDTSQRLGISPASQCSASDLDTEGFCHGPVRVDDQRWPNPRPFGPDRPIWKFPHKRHPIVHGPKGGYHDDPDDL